MAKLDTVTLFIEKESESHSVDATAYAVEKGEPFTDHVAKRPSEFSISGYILSNNFDAAKNSLIKSMEIGKVVKYTGKAVFSNVVILDISGEHGEEVKNGMAISIKLRRIRITTTPWQKVPPKTKPVVKPVTQSGKKKPSGTRATQAVYHTTRKGDTYWGWSKKYGTSITQLRAWNGWPDKKIPVPGLARVK